VERKINYSNRGINVQTSQKNIEETETVQVNLNVAVAVAAVAVPAKRK